MEHRGPYEPSPDSGTDGIRIVEVRSATVESLSEIEDSTRAKFIAVVVIGGLIALIGILARSIALVLLAQLIILTLRIGRHTSVWHYDMLPYRVKASFDALIGGEKASFSLVYLYYDSEEEARRAQRALLDKRFPAPLDNVIMLNFYDGSPMLVYPIVSLARRLEAVEPGRPGD